jgi:hypothetical protein
MTPDVEKRVFPRFPFCYLIFRPDDHAHVFEIVDLSRTGMQLSLKDGGHPYRPEQVVKGEIHWKQRSVRLEGRVRWVKGQRLGLSFDNEAIVDDFLSTDWILSRMRRVDTLDMGLEIPSNLKYWLQADGPVELFVWRHSDGEISRFHLILFDQFIEWEDGQGLRSGRVIQKRNMETPLISEDEFLFEMDQHVDLKKLQFGQSVFKGIGPELLPAEVVDFLLLKLS